MQLCKAVFQLYSKLKPRNKGALSVTSEVHKLVLLVNENKQTKDVVE